MMLTWKVEDKFFKTISKCDNLEIICRYVTMHFNFRLKFPFSTGSISFFKWDQFCIYIKFNFQIIFKGMIFDGIIFSRIKSLKPFRFSGSYPCALQAVDFKEKN